MVVWKHGGGGIAGEGVKGNMGMAALDAGCRWWSRTSALQRASEHRCPHPTHPPAPTRQHQAPGSSRHQAAAAAAAARTRDARAERVVGGAACGQGALDLGAHLLAAHAAGEVPAVLGDAFDALHRLLSLHVAHRRLRPGLRGGRERSETSASVEAGRAAATCMRAGGLAGAGLPASAEWRRVCRRAGGRVCWQSTGPAAAPTLRLATGDATAGAQHAPRGSTACTPSGTTRP